jgi:poly-gamma-glutamate capsule biosynthesis protein CapA/YwtB (metallophosphatase superfamily)
MATRGSLITSSPAAIKLRELLHAADFAFTNLEVLPSDGDGHPARDPLGGGCLVADSSVIDEISAAGFTIMGCANNHALDMGVEGLLGTMRLLADRRIPFSGIGTDLTAARMPVYADRPTGSLALISCCSSFLPGQEAAGPSPQLPGRPGLNPLRHTMTVNVTARQMDALRAIDAETGLKARRAEAVTLFGVDPATVSAGSLSLFGGRFRVADEPGLEIACDEGDVEEISRWVRDARKRADLVMISVHAHEPGPAPGLPPEFLREFAHRVIDEGADIVAGHGPHFLRGVELYREKPIFYGLGNVVSQIDLATLIPAEDYAKVPVPGQGPITPARFFAMRSRGDRILLGAHRKYWRTVVPVLTFDARRLIEARLYPVDLGYGEPVHRRGRPRLAARDEATDILETFAELSAPFQTKITIVDTGHGATGRLLLGDQPPA